MTEPYMLESGKVNPKSLRYQLGYLHIKIQGIESDLNDLKEIIGTLYCETLEEQDDTN